MKIDKFLDWGVNWGLTDVLTDVKHNVFVLCNPHAREMLLSFPAVCVVLLATCCHSVPLLCCTSATGGVM